MPVRFGLIGLGAWGVRHAATVSRLPNAILGAVATRNPNARDLIGETASVWHDWRDMLRGADLDAVIVATPPHPRQEIALAAISASIPALLEKPIALNLVNARQLLQESRRMGVMVSAGHLHLYAPGFQAVKTTVQLDGGASGIVSAGGNNGPFRDSYRALLDYGPHDISMAINLVGKPPARVTATLLKQGDNPPDELVQAVLLFEHCTAEITVGSQMSEKQRMLSVATPKGQYLYDDLAAEKASMTSPEGVKSSLPIADGMALDRQLSRFADLVASGQVEDPDFVQAVETTAVLDAVIRSLETGTTETVHSIEL